MTSPFRVPTDDKPTQLDKFKQAARDLECDEDEARFDERVRKLVKHKPVESERSGRMPSTIYHRNGSVALQGSGTNAGFAYHDNGARAFVASGTGRGYGYYRNGATAYVGPGVTNSGFAYRQNGQIISRDGSGLSLSLGPGIRMHVSRAGCQVSVEEP